MPDFASTGDWSGYLDWLIDNSTFESEKQQFKVWKETLSRVDRLVKNGITNCRDLILLIWTAGIASSDYFSAWPTMQSLLTAINKHFASLVQTDKAKPLEYFYTKGEEDNVWIRR